MAAKKKHVVRVKIPAKNKTLGVNLTTDVKLLIEQLRYADILKVVESTEERMIVDIYPPKGVQEDVWASMNAKRMRSFCISATAWQEK